MFNFFLVFYVFRGELALEDAHSKLVCKPETRDWCLWLHVQIYRALNRNKEYIEGG